MKLTRTTQTILKVGIVMLLVAIIAIIAITIHASKRTHNTSSSVAYTQEILFHAQKLLSLALENETGSRGYTLTGKKTFLQPVERSEKEIPQALAELQTLTTPDRLQQIRLDSLSLYLKKRVAFSKSTVHTYDSKGKAAAVAMIETGRGKFYTDQIRLLVHEVQSAENALLIKSKLRNDKAIRWLNTLLIALAVSVLLLVLFLLLLLRLQFTSLLKNEDDLKSQVDKKTGELHTFFERNTDAFVAIDSNWVLTYINKKAGEILAKAPNTIIGKNIWEQMPESIDQPFYKACYEAMEMQRYIHVEEYFALQNKWFESHIYPSPEGLSVFFREITEKRLAEDALAKSENRFRVLMENNYDLISLHDDSLNLIYRSPSALRITGWTDEDMKIANGMNHLHPDEVTEITLLIQKAISNPGRPYSYLARYRHKDGHFIWLEGTVTKVKDNEHISGLVFNSRDITERKNAEEEVQMVYTEMDTALNRITNSIVSVDREWRYTFLNDAAMATHPMGREKVIGEIIWDVHPQLSETVFGEKFKEVMEAQNATEFENYYPPFGIWVNMKLYPSANGLTLYYEDITERKLAAEAVRKSEEKFRQTFERITDGFVALDNDFNYTYVNSTAAFLSKSTPQQMMGKNMWTLFPEVVGTGVYNAFKQAMEDQKYISIEEQYLPYKTWLAYHIYPSQDGISVYMKDITEIKQAEHEIREKENFISSIINASPDIIYIYDIEEGRNIYSNDGLQTNLGYTDKEVKEMGNQLIPLLMEPEDFDHYLQHTYPRYAAAKDNEFITHEFRMKHKKGMSRWLSVKESIFTRNPDGTPKQIFGFGTDITERKSSEQLLTESEEKQKAILQTLTDNVIILNAAGDIQYINHVSLGPSESEVTGSNWLLWLHKEDRGKAKTTIDQTLATGAFSEIQLRAFGPHKKITWFNIRIVRMPDVFNQQVLLVATDITERKKVEEELRSSQNRAKKIFDSGMIGFIFWDANGEILDANDRFLEMTGYSQKDLQEKKINWSKMTPPEFAEMDRQGLEQITLTGICQPFEKEYIRKDGSRMPVLVGATSIEGTNPEKGVAYVMDITERKKAEEQVLKSEELLFRAFHKSPAGIIISRISDGKIIDINESFLAMFELTREEAIGHTSTELNLISTAESLRLQQVQKDTAGVTNFELSSRTKSGKPIHILFSTNQLEINEELCHISSLIDNTERKIAEAEIIKTTEQVRELTAHLETIRDEERKRIGREIHDELGQQLTAIKMDAVWIDKHMPGQNDAIKSKLQNILELLDGGHQSVRKILNELRPAILDENSLLEVIQWQGRQFLESTGTPVFFTSNRNHIKLPQETATCIFRVYQESLTNIMRHAAASKVISSLNTTKDYIILTLEDDGNGFDMAVAESKKRFGLLGMKERVFAMKGKFVLLSSPGNGTKIEIKLPFKEL